MSTHPITAGHGYTYLTRQTAAQDASLVAGGGLGAYYAERGEAPGRWLGRGLVGLGVEPGTGVTEDQMIALFGEGRHPDVTAIEAALRARGQNEDIIAAATKLGTPFALNLANSEFRRQVAQLIAEWNAAEGRPATAAVPDHVASLIRTVVGQSLFAQEHGREPDARELSDFIATQSRLGSKAVAGYDLTFSPVKSVSALWALAEPAVAEQIEHAHHAAVAETVAWLERNAAYTRLGRNGVRQVEARGLIAAAFVHRSSRAGDPDLHTHVAVSNKVQTLDGRWRALDGRVLFKATVAASEHYNTRLEAELRGRLGLRFVECQRAGRRTVREIAGVEARVLAAWSKRRSAIDVRRGELSAAFQAEHGRPPTAAEAIALAQRATLETRPRKHEPRSAQDQRAAWLAEAEMVLGATGVTAMLHEALGAAPDITPTWHHELAREIGQRVVDRVQTDRATWQRWHVEAEVQRELRRLAVPVDQLDAAAEQAVACALGECSVALPRPVDVLSEPAQLRRSDGASVYTVTGSQLYSSRAVLDAEQSLLTAANRMDGRRAGTAAIEMALLEAMATGPDLNDGQRAFVRELAGSGARCQLALAPAGTGKTSALRVLARAWQEDGGRVVALAPSAAAARLLGGATGVEGETLAKQLQLLDAGRYLLGSDVLVLVDEAGMAGTVELARLVAHVLEAGASLRLVGDDRQLAAIGAGGVLRDLAETAGAATLTAAVRFSDPAEAAAALGLRDGSPDALEFYRGAGRVHVGDEHTAATSAYEAWRADREAGRDAVLLAATRQQVAALNVRARADRITAAGRRDDAEVRLADGSAASAGDAIITRRNDRRLRISATDWVKNGDRWTVEAVLAGGALRVRHHDTARLVTLPASYVAEHVALGYALTIHAAQGATADTCHTVISGSECREQLYVAMTRGRHANPVHVVMPGATDEHAPLHRDSLVPPTADDLLRRALDREQAAGSATTEARKVTNPTRQLHDAAERYLDSVAAVGSVSDAPARGPAPLPWLPPVPAADDAGNAYFDARAAQIRELAHAITRQVLARSSRSTALSMTDEHLLTHLTLWDATHGETPDCERLTRRERLYRQHLDDRHAAVRHGAPEPEQRWRALVMTIDPAAVQAAEYPQLARALSYAFDRRVDVDEALSRLLVDGDRLGAAAELRRLGDERRARAVHVSSRRAGRPFGITQTAEPPSQHVATPSL
jgi:conjugative relaxase-like TrwC/TraI family protein